MASNRIGCMSCRSLVLPNHGPLIHMKMKLYGNCVRDTLISNSLNDFFFDVFNFSSSGARILIVGGPPENG